MNRRRVAALVAWGLLAAACGRTVIVVPLGHRPAAVKQALKREVHRERRLGAVTTVFRVGTSAINGAAAIHTRAHTGAGSAPSSDARCATTSNPAQGYTANSLTIGTIIPLTGALRPLGEQTLSAMKVAIDTSLNNSTHIPGPYSA